jgi:hypothetical protein
MPVSNKAYAGMDAHGLQHIVKLRKAPSSSILVATRRSHVAIWQPDRSLWRKLLDSAQESRFKSILLGTLEFKDNFGTLWANHTTFDFMSRLPHTIEAIYPH